MFRMALRQFVENELTPHAEEWDKAEGFPQWVWTRLGELGYLSMTYPEEFGGQNCVFVKFAPRAPRRVKDKGS